MKKQIYLHGEGLKRPQVISVSEDLTAVKIIEEFLKKSNIENSEKSKLSIFIENNDAINKGDEDSLSNIVSKSHLHCHRCKKVHVKVNYNGQEIEKKFPPSKTVGKIFKWTIKEFGITEEDAADLVLRLGGANGQILDNTEHIGSFVTYPNCEVTLFLTPKVLIQG